MLSFFFHLILSSIVTWILAIIPLLEVSTGHSKIMPPMGLTLNLLVLPKELPCDMQSLEAYPKD